MGQILNYIEYLLGLALLFAIAAAIGHVGISLRYGFRGRRRSLVIGVVGLLVLGGIGFLVARSDDGPLAVSVYAVLVLILLALGWSGRLIVPEGLGD